MPNLNLLKQSFSGGEISPTLWSRTDLSLYSKAMKLMRNFIVHPHGSASNRPGLIYQGIGKFTDDREIRLISFKYSTLQNYMLEFGDLYMRFYTNLGGTPAQISTSIYSPDQYDKLLMHFDGANYGVVFTEETGKTCINTGITEFNYMEYATDGAAQAAFVTSDGAHLQCYSEGTIKSQGSYSLKVVADTSSLNKKLTLSY